METQLRIFAFEFDVSQNSSTFFHLLQTPIFIIHFHHSVMAAPTFPSTVFGNPNASELLVFLAGFPDDSTRGSTLQSFAKTHRVISLCLPGYEAPKAVGGQPAVNNSSALIPAAGYSFAELLTGMHATIEALLLREPSQLQRLKRPFVLVGHDWGAFMSMLYQNAHPDRVRRLVLLDVGQLQRPPIKSALIIFLYQIWFAISFLLHRFLGARIGTWHLHLFTKLVPTWLQPVRVRGEFPPAHRPLSELTAHLCYPYFHFWKGIFTGTVPKPRFSSCPLLFMVSQWIRVSMLIVSIASIN